MDGALKNHSPKSRDMTNDIQEKIKKISSFYGYDAQSRQCIEEMAELTQAINKFWRKVLYCGKAEQPNGEKYITINQTYDNLVEEMADVQIMLWQLEYLLNADTSIIIQQKIDRQMEGIERE